MTPNKERLQKIASWRETYGAGSNVMLPAEEAEAMARMLLEQIDSEPFAYIIQDKYERERGVEGHLSRSHVSKYVSQEDISEHEITCTPLYRHAQQPVVPPMQHWEELCREHPDMSIGDAIIRAAWWNHCRAAMLQACAFRENANSSTNNFREITETSTNEPVTQIKPVSDLYGITSPTGSETMFTFDPVEASNLKVGGWSVQEYVELERLQEAVVGSSPVIPDGSEDTKRLNWLDAQNKRLNEYYGTSYGWKFDANFQRNAMMLNDSNYPVMTVRQAIDEAIAAAPQEVKGE